MDLVWGTRVRPTDVFIQFLVSDSDDPCDAVCLVELLFRNFYGRLAILCALGWVCPIPSRAHQKNQDMKPTNIQETTLTDQPIAVA